MVVSDRSDGVASNSAFAASPSQRTNGRPQSIAVTSGKGGVGKSNIAVNLAICLAAARKRVVLVDLDAGLANADVLLDLHPRHNLAHVVAGLCDVSDAMVTGPCGIRFIAGGSGVGGLANMGTAQRRLLLRRIRQAAVSSDVVVYDCGAGISANVTDCAVLADTVLIVSTPEPTALTDAYAMVKVLSRQITHNRVALLVNMADGREQAQRVFLRVARVAERFLRFSLADAGYVLHDARVQSAVRERRPFVIGYPRCPSSLCVAALAARLSSQPVAGSTGGGVFARLANLFS